MTESLPMITETNIEHTVIDIKHGDALEMVNCH